MIYLLVFKFPFIYLKGSEAEGDNTQEISYLQVHSLKAPKSRGWARPKPETKKFIQVSHLSGRSTNTWAVLVAFQGGIFRILTYEAELGIETRTSDVEFGCTK